MSDFSGFMCAMLLVGFGVWFMAEPRIYPESVHHAESVCAPNGGWSFIEEGRSRFASVTCKNGAEFYYNWNDIQGGEK